MYICNQCKKEIKNDVAHINENKVYHLSCYKEHLHDDEDHRLFECPSCHTLGKRWSKKRNKWKVCKLCKGAGYLSILEGCP